MPTAMTLGIIGICFVIGWAATGARRHYLALLGLGLIAAGGIAAVPAEQGALRALLIVVTVLLFLAALVAAVSHVKGRMAQLREESLAREQAFFEMFQATQAKEQAEEGATPGDATSPPGEQGGRDS